nr:MAG TPA: hypothetical protein [Caudoviricetes sp.]
MANLPISIRISKSNSLISNSFRRSCAVEGAAVIYMAFLLYTNE